MTRFQPPRTPAPELAAGQAVRVWDRFVRVFHGGLVLCVLLNFFWFDDGEDLHQWLGYTAAALVAARAVWGLVGSRHARFADFWPTPARLRRHLLSLWYAEPECHVGHNPLGALMMLVLMALVAGLGLTGWLQTADALRGSDAIEDLHEGLATALIALAGLHAAAAVLMGRLEGVNLVGAMITGTKVRAADPEDAAPLNPP